MLPYPVQDVAVHLGVFRLVQDLVAHALVELHLHVAHAGMPEEVGGGLDALAAASTGSSAPDTKSTGRSLGTLAAQDGEATSPVRSVSVA